MSDLDTSGNTVAQNLTAFFEAEEAPPIENAEEPKVEEPVVEEPVVEEPPPAEEPTPEEKPKEEPKTDEPDAERPEGEDEPETDAPEYPTEEELLADSPRSIPKKFIAKAAAWAAEAKEAGELKASLGGDPFIAPLTKMASALQKPNASTEEFQGFFDGVLEAAGDEALLQVMHMAVHMGFVNSDFWLEQPGTKAFGEQVKAMVDTAVQTKYGTSHEKLTEALKWDKDGSLDKLTPFLDDKFEDDEGDFDADKFYTAAKALYDEIREVRNNPTNRKLAEENLALKRQLEKPATETGKPEESDNSFGDYLTNTVKTIIPKVVWAKSPLMPLETDDDETKDLKEYFRNNLLNSIIQNLHGNTAKKALASGFKQHQHHTAVYQKQLTDALDAAVTQTNPEKAKAEKVLAKLYGKSRNAQLLPKPPVAPEAPLAPTQPREFESSAAPRTQADRLAKLTAKYAELEAVGR